jgi:MFS family permease
MQWLLNSYGYAVTLRVWAVTSFVLSAPLIYYVKPRVPLSQSTHSRPFDLSFCWTPTFLIYQFCNIIEALGYFLPTIYMPTYAKRLGASNVTASLTVVLCNVALVFGCVIMGRLVDKYHATTCILISTIGSTLSVFFVWGFAVSMAPLYLFCILYGIFAGSYTSAYPAVMAEVRKKKATADVSMIFGFLAAGRGIGNVISGPLTEALLRNYPWKDELGFGYGSGYGTLIIFTGATALLGGLSIVARPLKWV